MATEDCLKKRIEEAEARIRAAIARSMVPEDPIHAEDTLLILQELCPGADTALKLAALGHDIERAMPWGIRTNRDHFKDYDQFKKAHAENSSRIIRGILIKCHLPTPLVEEVARLVLHHETGGFKEADILKDADSLSFFRVNLPLFCQREPEQRVRDRIRWGISRLSKDGMAYLREMAEKDDYLRNVLKDVLKAVEGCHECHPS